ncbi:MAG: SDR family NAD(P)-dependent oxidoreductase [Myxococcales bacterium]|nr:SDR family NAD(P)-dependent oxidoreductase [Myxococcales bacterium]
MKTLKDKVVVITGAGGGIGAALARRMHAGGARVVLVDLERGAIDALADELPGAQARALDVADVDGWRALALEVADLGGADVLVNNAGITILGAFEQQSLEDLDRIVGVNLRGVLYGSRVFLTQLVERRGQLVNVSSLAGRVAFPYQSSYCATKFAVRGLGAALRLELAPRGVGVTTVLPGAVATRLLERAHSYDGRASQKMAELMLAHGTPPERVAARVVRAILRDEAEVIVGWDAHVATALASVAPAALRFALGSGFRVRSGRRPARVDEAR